MNYQNYINEDYDNALIFRDEKGYEECDMTVDMSWAKDSDPFFNESFIYPEETEKDKGWCILQKLMITNAVEEVKQYSYKQYKMVSEINEQEVQRMVISLNETLKCNTLHDTFNGCSVRVLSYLWGHFSYVFSGSHKKNQDNKNKTVGNICMIELKSDGSHVTPVTNDPFSSSIIFSDKNWIDFDSDIVPTNWHQLSCRDFTQGLNYNPYSNKVTTSLVIPY
jgi:hypothetical protein